ncbi:MAG: hypothetical protein HYV63_25495 [Candidatus Schekmanbacteria bacterium]|nr:hypothetical protein [Candidatus Schekmanbacteria bacterium]
MGTLLRQREEAIRTALEGIGELARLRSEVLREIETSEAAPEALLGHVAGAVAAHGKLCRTLFDVALSTYAVDGARGRYQDATPAELRSNVQWWADLSRNLLQSAIISVEVSRCCPRDDFREPSSWAERAFGHLLLTAAVFRAVWGQDSAVEMLPVGQSLA